MRWHEGVEAARAEYQSQLTWRQDNLRRLVDPQVQRSQAVATRNGRLVNAAQREQVEMRRAWNGRLPLRYE